MRRAASGERRAACGERRAGVRSWQRRDSQRRKLSPRWKCSLYNIASVKASCCASASGCSGLCMAHGGGQAGEPLGAKARYVVPALPADLQRRSPSIGVWELSCGVRSNRIGV